MIAEYAVDRTENGLAEEGYLHAGFVVEQRTIQTLADNVDREQSCGMVESNAVDRYVRDVLEVLAFDAHNVMSDEQNRVDHLVFYMGLEHL